MRYLQIIILFVFLSFILPVQAQDIPEPMSPPRLVNDFSGVFSVQERDNLERMLLNYNDTTSTQIYVVTVNDLQGYAVSDYAFRLGEKWGIGQKSKNNGAVILIKPKTSNSRGQVFIAVGYGLEPYLNDARIGRILDNYMIPYLRQDDYYQGTVATANAMIQYLSGQFQADEEEQPQGISGSDIIIGIILIILFIYFMNKIDKNNNRGGKGNRGRSGPPIFFPPMSGGRFGGGGFGGGGFGGGGGGSFGGGGAGRGW